MESTLSTIVDKSWHPLFDRILKFPELNKLNTEILPQINFFPKTPAEIFRVFMMPVSKINVVILGQDPYPKPGQANGLAFAVNSGVHIPVSLDIIRQELNKTVDNSIGRDSAEWKTLTGWFYQGVFLLNTALTVQYGMAGSHLDYWKNFTSEVISFIAQQPQKKVWMMWGGKAKAFIPLITNTGNTFHNHVLEAGHPATESYSPGAGSFFGCNHFNIANQLLASTNQTINWKQ